MISDQMPYQKHFQDVEKDTQEAIDTIEEEIAELQRRLAAATQKLWALWVGSSE